MKHVFFAASSLVIFLSLSFGAHAQQQEFCPDQQFLTVMAQLNLGLTVDIEINDSMKQYAELMCKAPIEAEVFDRVMQQIAEAGQQIASGGKTVVVAGSNLSVDGMFPIEEMPQVNRDIEIPLGTEVNTLVIPESANYIEIIPTPEFEDTAAIRVEMAADEGSVHLLEPYINGYSLSVDGEFAELVAPMISRSCALISQNQKVMMKGLCTTAVKLYLPPERVILVLDEDRNPVNDAQITMTMSRFLLAYKQAPQHDKLDLLEDFVANENAENEINKAQALELLNGLPNHGREEGLVAIAPVLAEGALDNLGELLMRLPNHDRDDAIEDILGVLPSSLSGELLASVMVALDRLDRDDILAILAPRVVEPLDFASFEIIISQLDNFDRLEGFQMLAAKVPVESREDIFTLIRNKLGSFDQDDASRYMEQLE